MANQDMLSVVIVNWNAGPRLSACVDSLARHGGGLIREIIVIDNQSVDGSETGIEHVPGVTLVRANANLGFGRACNLGARQARSDYLLFLNPDAEVRADTLPTVLAFLEDPANVRTGICGVQLEDESGRIARSCARLPSAGRFLAHAVGLDRPFPRLGQVMSEWDHAQTREVDQVIGAFFLVRRTLFETLQGFDERFFVYFEEVDFSLRARLAGWRSAYFAGAQAFHAGRGTTDQIKARRLFYYLRSRLLYARKHFRWPQIAAVALITLVVEPITRSAGALGRRSCAGVGETWAAYALLWRWLPRWVIRGEHA